jgi:predicted AAA+ superfamily ATPase
MLEELRKLSLHFLTIKNSQYRRFFIQKTSLSHRLSILIGQRGVGKTTTLVQALLDYARGDSFSEKILYIQADHFQMGLISLYEVAEQFQAYGGELMAIDEIHKYPHWSKELKSIYDTFPNLKILASGSSALEIHRGTHDLTRRAIVYRLPGLSFREYLELTHDIELDIHSLNEICSNQEKITRNIVEIFDKMEIKILQEFQKYLKVGYFPYFFEIKEAALYMLTLEQNLHTTIESDLAAIYPQLTTTSIQKIKKLLIYIANSVPFTPNWQKIMGVLEIGDMRTLKNYFEHLEDAGLIRSLGKATEKFSQLETPTKVFLNNSNQLFAISSNAPEIGTVRETCFLSMVSEMHRVQLPVSGDFIVDDQYLFEVGGKNKSRRQLNKNPNGYLVYDGIEHGVGAKIPLWLFGFLY